MENNTFNYSYSATRNKEVESIRKKYLPVEESKIERLKKLDSRVQAAGSIEALCLGVIGALVFGIGMCFFLRVFSGGLMPAVIFMVIGSLIMIPAYPIYKKIAQKTKAELTPSILKLSEEILKP